ncbi:MAG TPA: DUF4405 domain-containing protein [Candidatus Desulfaltia sp.]|nr:DUF4405 domain-containing protein [Candidatus Desulfaltia sp.]
MKESDWRYIVDALLFICLVGMAFIGILLGLVISEGPASSGGSKYFLGLHRHQWGDLHAYLSIAFVVLMAVHLVLSWKWIKAKTRQIFKRGSAPALLSIAALPFGLLLLFWLITPKDADIFRSYGVGAGEGQRTQWVQPREAPPPVAGPVRQDDIRATEKPAVPDVTPEHFRDKEHHAQVGSITITGQQTLHDLENATAIPASEIIKRIGLPERTLVDETLDRLRRLYGFEIQDVRNLVARLLKERESGLN